jgi:hypothetical protein
MSQQNFKNHVRYVPLWHYVTGLILIFLLIGSIYYIFSNHISENRIIALLLLMVSLILCSMFWFIRSFALKAQDRAIRAEENLRHYVLTGKLLDKRLRTNQIIALRFASDDEFVPLAQKAAEEHTRSQAIKKSIKHWRADNHRV